MGFNSGFKGLNRGAISETGVVWMLWISSTSIWTQFVLRS